MSMFYIGCYWASRAETRSECAVSLYRFLDKISKMHGSFSHWFQTGKTVAQAKKRVVSVDEKVIDSILTTNRSNVKKTPNLELGFNIHIWNGDEAKPVTLMATCGCYSPFVKNNVVLSLPVGMEGQFSCLVDPIADELNALFRPEKIVVQRGDGSLEERILR